MPTTAPWRQYAVSFTDRDTAHQAAVQMIAPALEVAHAAGLLHNWWFLRKVPWRLRCRVTEPAAHTLEGILDALVREGQATEWTIGIYEPETLAFGGPDAMEVAHQLFHADSRYRTAPTIAVANLGPRETVVIGAATLCRAAGLDRFEHGDVWRRFADLRPEPAASTEELIGKLWRLMTCDGYATLAADPAQLDAGGIRWLETLADTGQVLACMAYNGRLQRGLRAVLAHHLMFLANHAGLSLADQATLAHLAVNAVFHTGSPINQLSKVPSVTTHSDQNHLSAGQLRADLVDRLERQGAARNPHVIAALRTVPREQFVPGVPAQQAYADDSVYTKKNTDGIAISAASQPTIVAVMLEQLGLQPGHKVFEAGAGTGYNAALMATIVGDEGRVTAVDVDLDLVEDARAHLATVGVTNVEVVLGDGFVGHEPNAPYDRVIATVGAHQIPSAWLDQLAPGGRLLVPLRLRGTTTRCITFERDSDGWRDVNTELAVFMPLRGIGDDAYQLVYPTSQRDIQLQVHQDQTVDPGALSGVFDTKRHERWTGVLFPPEVPYAWLDLWLACTLDNALMRMNVQRAAVDRGTVTPMFGWGSMATVRGADLAYLTTRPAPLAADGGKRYEVGVVGHGPVRDALADETADQIRHWDTHYRTKTVTFTMPAVLPDPAPAIGRFVLPRDENPIVVAWS